MKHITDTGVSVNERPRPLNRKKSIIFCLLFFAISAFCAYGWLIPARELSGVQAQASAVEINAKTLADGSCQSSLESLWNNTMPGRAALIRTRNQILYSLLWTSSNANVAMGWDKNLIEPEYIGYELDIFGQKSDEELNAQIEKIAKLEKLLAKNGKRLYVFISPSKAHFESGSIPLQFLTLDRRSEYESSFPQRFAEALDNAGITYFNSTDYIESNLDRLSAPVFYKTGIHWSGSWGCACALGLLDVIRLDCGLSLNRYEIEEHVSSEPIFPATDLYDSLNLWAKAREVWYEQSLKVTEEGADKPNVFFRGSSFMGQSFAPLAQTGCFGNVVHLENNYYFTDNYTQYSFLSSRTAYDEMALDSLMGGSDILILESTEAGLQNFSFGFVDYLLKHPEFLDSKY